MKKIGTAICCLSAFSIMPMAYGQEQTKIQPAACLSSYQDCLQRAAPWCQDNTANIPTVQRAAEYARCLTQYQAQCRMSYCD